MSMMGQRRDPLRPPEAPGLGRGVAFALVAHVLLLAALSSGVQWRSKTLPTFEAELWSAVPQAAAPKEVLPPSPPPEPEVKPQPKLQPPQPKVEDLQADRDAEIAIDKARALKVKRELERLADLEAQRKKQAAEEKQQKLEQAKLDKLEKQKQAKEDKAKAAKEDAKHEAQLQAQRQANLRRIQGMAGASGDANATGSALKSSGPSASYGGRVAARVKPQIDFPGARNFDSAAEVEIRCAPDGRVISSRLTRSSGNRLWDDAVLNAVLKTEMFPRDTNGTVPPVLIISFRPND